MMFFPSKHLLQYFGVDLEVLCYSAKTKNISCLRTDCFVILLSLKSFILVPNFKITTVLHKKLIFYY